MNTVLAILFVATVVAAVTILGFIIAVAVGRTAPAPESAPTPKLPHEIIKDFEDWRKHDEIVFHDGSVEPENLYSGHRFLYHGADEGGIYLSKNGQIGYLSVDALSRAGSFYNHVAIERAQTRRSRHLEDRLAESTYNDFLRHYREALAEIGRADRNPELDEIVKEARIAAPLGSGDAPIPFPTLTTSV